MDQGFVSTTAGHYVRLALIFMASVFGLILLGFVFGSSSASADVGGPDDDGLVPAVAELAGGVVETVAPVTTPLVTAAIPLADVPLSPAAPVVRTLVKTVDSTIDALTTAVAPLVHLLSAVLPATATAPASAASIVTAAGTLISGTANGFWPDARDPFGTGSIASGASVTTTALPAAALGAGFLVLLFSRRLRLVNSALPVSPVYETDTSPD